MAEQPPTDAVITHTQPKIEAPNQNPQSPPSPKTINPPPTNEDVSSNSTNPSKIPIRPQKIRKLSGEPKSTTDANAGSIVVTATTTTTVSNSSKNRRRTVASKLPVPAVIKPLSSAAEIAASLRHLRSADPLLSPLIDTLPPPQFDVHLLPFVALTKSILYQQLAYKAGTSVYTRFVSLCGGEDSIGPDSVLALSTQQLKQIGVSGRKASYLYDLANKYKTGILSDETLVKMDDRSLFTMLSMVKGIGSWSVHMFMIFSLHRPDVLPASDLGVRKGVQMLYGLEELPKPSQMEQLCEKWRPYRSVGSWYMWRLVEGKGGGGGVVEGGGIVQPLLQIEVGDDGDQQQQQLQFVEPINGMGNIGWLL